MKVKVRRQRKENMKSESDEEVIRGNQLVVEKITSAKAEKVKLNK